MTSKVLHEPGDVIVESIDLVDIKQNNQPVSLIDLVYNVDIFESIKSPVITGSINVVDSINLRETYPIINDKCKVIIKFKTYAGAPTRTFELLIKDITNLNIDRNSQNVNYTLSLCSIEILNNSKQLFTAPLRQKKIDQYVNYILKEIIGTSKSLTLDSGGTKGIQDLDIIQMKPFQSIDFLRRRAVSTNYKSSTYSFFENKSGFVFAPVEYLFERKEGKLGKFTYDTQVKQDFIKSTYNNIIAYQHIAQQSTTKMIQEGALKNVTTSLDLRTRTYETVVFDLSKEFSSFKFPGRTSKINKDVFEYEYGKKPAITNYIINMSKNPDNFLLQKIGFNKAFTELLTQNVLRIMTWGDSNLSAGYKVDCTVPASQGLTIEKSKIKNSKSQYVSGEYLISSLRHSFSKLQNKFRYTNSSELIKGTYGESA